MNSSKILVIALAGITLLVVAFVFLINPLFARSDGRRAGAGDVPRIAIITPHTVQVIRSTETIERGKELASVPHEAGSPQSAAGADQQKNAAGAGANAPGAAEPHREAAEVAQTMLLASIDLLSGALSDRLDRSGRVAVVDPVQVSQVLAEMGRRSLEGASGASDKEAREDFIDALQRTVAGQTERSIIPAASDKVGTRTEGSSSRTTSASASSRTQSLDRADIGRAASDLQADYLLVVYVAEPQVDSVVRYIADTPRHVHIVRFDPPISFRLIDGKTGTVMLSRNMRIERPIEIVYDDSRPPSMSDYRQAYIDLWDGVAVTIAALLMDEIYPAQISVADGKRMAIDRGSVDGAQVGDVYEITREVATAVGAGDVALSEGVREKIGSVEVTRVQETLSLVRVVSVAPGEDIRRGDRVAFAAARTAPRASADAEAPTSPAAAPALGVRMRNASAQAKPRIAVREAVMRFIDCRNCGAGDPRGTILSEAFMARLQDEPRVTVMTRRDLEAAIQERNLSDNSEGRKLRYGEQGMLVSHYLVTGELTVRPEANATRERIAGQVVETSRSPRLVGTGEFRILDAETTEVVETASVRVSVSGGVSEAGLRRLADAAAEAATTQFLNRLFPLAVLGRISDQAIEISGGAQAGLTEGARLQVYAMGQGVVDLYSDQTTQTRTRSGVIVVHDVRRDRATARFESRPFPISRGDLLEVLPAKQRSRPASSPARRAPAEPAADRF